MNSTIFSSKFHFDDTIGKTGEAVGECEVCGAMKVGTRSVLMGKAQVNAYITRCVEKLGLGSKEVARNKNVQ